MPLPAFVPKADRQGWRRAHYLGYGQKTIRFASPLLCRPLLGGCGEWANRIRT